MTLTEVLIAMGILTLGLLGVASLFPVASFYMQTAETQDRGAAIAQAVMSDIVSRGMLNPNAWYVTTPRPATPNPLFPNYYITSVDGKYTPLLPKPVMSNTLNSTFTRPFAEALGTVLKSATANPVITSKQFGNAFVIDPMYAAAAALASTPSDNNVIAYPFPATAGLTANRVASSPTPYYSAPQWTPWHVTSATDRTWPIRRVTFQMRNGWQLNKAMAEQYCRINDDLTTDLPDRDDRPAIQNWEKESVDIGGDGNLDPIARQWTGDYSWIVSVVPTTSAARDGMSRNPESFLYDVSVVVFYKRVLPTAPATNASEQQYATQYERMVNAKIVSTGLNGGEVLLTDLKDILDGTAAATAKSRSPFSDLRVGQWIMLCGPHPNSNATVDASAPGGWKGEPRFVLNWYQVLAVEGKEKRLNNQGTTDPAPGATEPERRLVTLRGPQWPWQPSANIATYNSDLSNCLCAGICRGAVAVHTKTMRLDSLRGWGSAMSLASPPGVPDTPWKVY